MDDQANRKQRGAAKMSRGPLGDARPDAAEEDSRTEGGQPPEKVEDRPTGSTVKPEDYPSQR